MSSAAHPRPSGTSSNPQPARASPSVAASGAGNTGASRQPRPKTIAEPIVRNALRYSISTREYAVLHKYIISRSRLLRRAAPSVSTVERLVDGEREPGRRRSSVSGGAAGSSAGDFNARAIRHALRLFLATGLGMKAWDAVQNKISRKEPDTKNRLPFYKGSAFRLSLSVSSILLLYRLLFRFMNRLRAQLLDPSAVLFRNRNPKTSAALTSPYAPAVGASLAGLMLGIYPGQQLRVSIAIFTLFRALEFGWNLCEEEGLIWGYKAGGRIKRERPWWFGSWMTQPFVFGQLLHAMVFDRDCFPMTYGNFILGSSTAYLHPRPTDYPARLPWPKPYEVVNGLAEMARSNWPHYISPTMFPNKTTLPASLASVAPLTAKAHPLITSLSCAALHPNDPSCLRTYVTFWLQSFPPLARFFVLFYSAFTLPKFAALYNSPVATLNRVLAKALSMSTFVTGAISTAWATICFFQMWFPRSFLPTQRFFLGGFLAGLWAWVERRNGRSAFLYSARASLDSLWKVGIKRRWWRAMKGGDLLVFVFSLMVTGVVYEKDSRAIKEGSWRKGVSWVRGEGFHDWAMDENQDEGAESEKED